MEEAMALQFNANGGCAIEVDSTGLDVEVQITERPSDDDRAHAAELESAQPRTWIWSGTLQELIMQYPHRSTRCPGLGTKLMWRGTLAIGDTVTLTIPGEDQHNVRYDRIVEIRFDSICPRTWRL